MDWSSITRDDIFVFLVGELCAVPLIWAGWDRFVNRDYPNALVGLLFGFSLAIASGTYHGWKFWVRDWVRSWTQRNADRWLPFVILMVFAFVCGLTFLSRLNSQLTGRANEFSSLQSKVKEEGNTLDQIQGELNEVRTVNDDLQAQVRTLNKFKEDTNIALKRNAGIVKEIESLLADYPNKYVELQKLVEKTRIEAKAMHDRCDELARQQYDCGEQTTLEQDDRYRDAQQQFKELHDNLMSKVQSLLNLTP
jgi:hypothetical protein